LRGSPSHWGNSPPISAPTSRSPRDRTRCHRELLETAPRLSNAVEHLIAEHAAITALVEDLLTRASRPASNDDVDAIRDLATGLPGRLARHRQRGADLIYEAYETGIGGETRPGHRQGSTRSAGRTK